MYYNLIDDLLLTVSLLTTAYCTSVLFGKEYGVLKFLRESATLEEVQINNVFVRETTPNENIVSRPDFSVICMRSVHYH